MYSMLSAMRNSRSARHDTGLRETLVDGGTSRWRPRRRRRRPRPPPSFLAAAAAYPSDNDGFTIPLGAQCGLRVPRLILGTMQFGEALGPGEAHAIMTAAAEEGQAALAAAAAAGGDESKSPFLALDTAEAYPVPMAGRTSGDSERIIGDWLRAGSAPGKGGSSSSRRERTVLITKVSGPGDQPWIRGGPPRLDGDHFKRALEGSLRRLRVDELDLVMLHWPDRYVPMFGEVEFDPTRSFFPSAKTGRGGGGGENDVDGENDDEDDDDDGFAEAERHFEDVLCAAFDAVSAGKLRAVGLSNETPTGLLAAASASRRGRRRERRRRGEEEEGEGEEGGRQRQRRKGNKRLLLFPGVAAVSNAYSLLARNFDSNGMAEACEATRVPLLGYGPLAAGLLSGKYEVGGGLGGNNGGNGGGNSGDGDDFSAGGPPLARLNRYRHEYAEEGRRYARTPRVREAVRDYVGIARRHGLRGGGAELALRFALFSRQRPSSLTSSGGGGGGGGGTGRAAVFGATSVENVRAAFAAAAEGALSREIVAECDAVHARNPNPAP